MTGMDPTDFCTKINNSLDRPDIFIIHNITPCINLHEKQSNHKEEHMRKMK